MQSYFLPKEGVSQSLASSLSQLEAPWIVNFQAGWDRSKRKSLVFSLRRLGNNFLGTDVQILQTDNGANLIHARAASGSSQAMLEKFFRALLVHIKVIWKCWHLVENRNQNSYILKIFDLFILFCLYFQLTYEKEMFSESSRKGNRGLNRCLYSPNYLLNYCVCCINSGGAQVFTEAFL